MLRSDRDFSALDRLAGCTLWGLGSSVALRSLIHGSSLNHRLEDLRGKSLLIATGDQLTAALALLELDGIARRMVLCPPDLKREYIESAAEVAEIDAVILDGESPNAGIAGVDNVLCHPEFSTVDNGVDRTESFETEWILFTSGTTGMPKMAVHSFGSLAGPITGDTQPTGSVVWSTFYDIRRYGGLQIFLRAFIDGTSLVLSNAHESTAEFLIRAASHNVTHISGTPSHWRRALMSPSANEISPRYVRLSGEIVDQPILDNLRSYYPESTIIHAFASTEAGVGFDVRDGRAGFPVDVIGRTDHGVDLKIVDGSLRVRSTRNACRYLGKTPECIAEPDGFVDTRDVVELHGDRYYFIGRRDGVINVGGLKVHPEEVEAVINRHPSVQMSLVRARRNPITGALVVADIVLKPGVSLDRQSGESQLKSDILTSCRDALAAYKVPAQVKIVTSLNVTDSGKLARL